MIRKWRALIIATVLLLVLVSGGCWSVYRYTMGFRTLAIKGNQYVTQEDVRRIAIRYQGRNALLVSIFGRMNHDITRGLPKVQAVKSDFKWPHAIELTVVEKPAWIRCYSNGVVTTVAADGAVLDRQAVADKLVHSNLLTVTNLPDSVFIDGRLNSFLLTTLTPVVATIRDIFPDQQLDLELKGLTLSATGCVFDELTLIHDGIVPVYLGSEAQLAKKLGYLRQFIWYVKEQPTDAEARKSIRYIDLRVEGKVLVGYNA